MPGARRMILVCAGTYATVLTLSLLYVYAWRPGHGAITQFLPALVLMQAAILVVIVGTCMGAYRLTTLPITRTPGNMAVVIVGVGVTGGWLSLWLLG